MDMDRQINGTKQSLEIDPHIYGQLIFDKDFNKWCWRSYWGKIWISLKTQLRWITDLHLKAQTIKLLKENMGQYRTTCNDFLQKSRNHRKEKKTPMNWISSKFKTSGHQNDKARHKLGEYTCNTYIWQIVCIQNV